MAFLQFCDTNLQPWGLEINSSHLIYIQITFEQCLIIPALCTRGNRSEIKDFAACLLHTDFFTQMNPDHVFKKDTLTSLADFCLKSVPGAVDEKETVLAFRLCEFQQVFGNPSLRSKSQE